MSKSSPPNVLEAYQKKFDTDFRKFLQMRSEELVQGGCMVLTFVGRSIADPTIDDCCIIWKLLAQSLHDILKEVKVFFIISFKYIQICFSDLLIINIWLYKPTL